MATYGAVLTYSVLFCSLQFIESLECHSCQALTNDTLCDRSTTCGVNEFCLMDKRDGTVTYGCANSQQCNSGSKADVLVGRDVFSRQTSDCHECCSTDLCNANLCVHLKPSACTDDTRVDCAMMNTVIGICGDIRKAKVVCPKYCNLCTLVDGQWTDWSSWSLCSVTCDNGTASRTRSCSNPAPAHGGLDCEGSASQTEQCTLKACPVHGGWSIWSEWGSCSSSCDVGMQRRDRSCSNPYPSPDGNPCFGDYRDDRICMPGACADGVWTEWESWSSCSSSCGGGLKSRERTCTNPPPSLLGRFCSGTPIQTMQCNNQVCSDHKIIFSAHGISSGNASELVFPSVLVNYGNGYSNTTGRFTCTIPGLYYFSTTLTKAYGIHSNHVYCYIKVNSETKTGTYQDSVGDGLSGFNINLSATFYLDKNDSVNIGNCSGQNALRADEFSSFTGFLITPDV